MSLHRILFTLFIWLVALNINAQQTVTVISRCGGVDTLTIPTITDNDHDGIDDHLEQLLLNRFMPTVIQFNDESCPGPALDGTGDSNLIVCRIFAYPQQYTRTNSMDSVLTQPVPVIPAHGLRAGLVWYNTLIMVHTALLYGKDCGLLGHTADVEGFTFTLKYTGPDTATGWMYDTVMAHWMGGTIQTISHASTLCEQKETFAYKSALYPTGKDTIYASPDKHGNYLTLGGCGASFFCNPGCGGTPSIKHVVNINLGEAAYPFVTNLGTCYAAYAGNNPWGSLNFLDANNGSAGTIIEKMDKPLTTDFIQGIVLTTNQICGLYVQCYGVQGSAMQQQSCTGSYTFYGQQLTQSGTYTHALTNVYGCDSLITLNLTVGNASAYAYTDYLCAGNTYNFNGTALTTAGTYNHTLTNHTGCDSVVTLQLTTRQAVAQQISAAYCRGGTYVFGTSTLNAAGVYTDTLTAGNGCDSIVTLTLSLDTGTTINWAGADTIIATGHAMLLTAAPPGGVYTGTGVSGNIFYPDSAGNGAHVITYTFTNASNCNTRSSKTYLVNTVTGITNNALAQQILIYPNPANNLLYVQTNGLQPTQVTIYNATGHKMGEYKYAPQIDITQLTPGIYFIEFKANSLTSRYRFVKL